MATRKLLGGVLAVLGAIAGCDEGQDDTRDVDVRSAGQGWFPIAGGMQLLHYEVVDGVAIFEGDVVLGDVDEFTAVELGEREPDRGAAIPNMQWPNATLVYAFDPGLPQSVRDAVLDGMSTLSARANITFVERTNEKDYVNIFRGKPGECWSYIGKLGGKQDLSLGDGCEYGRPIVHELCHALGLYHEQSRSDRDTYVDVHWENIQPGRESQFQTFVEMKQPGINLGQYDFDSIMHYGPDAFTKMAGLLTLTKKDGTPVPYNTSLSSGDVSALQALYVAGPWPCGNGIIEATEQCDFGAGNDAATMYRGGDGSSCGDDWQEVCDAGCGTWRTLENKGLEWDCDVHDWCDEGLDCWMSSTDGGCVCTARCGNGWVEEGEACDYGEGNRVSTIYAGGDGASCGWDQQSVCTAGCAAELTRDNGGLTDCDAGDDCSVGFDCWMGWDGACTCTQ